jgi:hypothetical protein
MDCHYSLSTDPVARWFYNTIHKGSRYCCVNSVSTGFHDFDPGLPNEGVFG